MTVGAAPAGAHGGDPEDYRWVSPPAEFADTNESPLDRDVALLTGPGPALVWTGDLQVMLDLATAPDVDDPWATIAARDPGELPPLPGGLEPVGNAYEIAVADGPNGPAAADADGTVRLSLPHVASAGFVLVDGAWTELGTTVVDDDATLPAVVVPYAGAGTYLAATSHADGGPPVAVLLAAPVLAFGALHVLARRRAPDGDAEATPSAGAPTAGVEPASTRRA